MRSCRRSNELRDALAAEEELAPDLAAHLVACADCTRAAAAASRFESSLDSAMAALVTDALPPSTAVVARTAPRASPSWSSPRTLSGAIVAVALGAFAAIGVVTTGSTISDAILHGPRATEPNDGLTVDCSFGEAAVEVVAIDDSATAGQVLVAYCFDVHSAPSVEGERSVTCLQAVDGNVSRARTRSDRADRIGHLGACTRVETGAVPADRPDTGNMSLPPATPIPSWAEARLATTSPVLRPRWLPTGYDLVTLQGFAPSTDPEAFESVVATYLRRGVAMSIEQFVVADPDSFRVVLNVLGDSLDQVTTGRTTVGRHAAFWADGVENLTVIGPGGDAYTIVLTWTDGRVGYRITARDLELEDLRRIATSLDVSS